MAGDEIRKIRYADHRFHVRVVTTVALKAADRVNSVAKVRDERVPSCAVNKQVIPSAAPKGIIASTGVKPRIRGTAQQIVGHDAPIHPVVAGATVKPAAPGHDAQDHVTAGHRMKRIIVLSTMDLVTSPTAQDHVGTIVG